MEFESIMIFNIFILSMIFEPNIFYKTYLKDYHKTKATYLKRILDSSKDNAEEFFKDETDPEVRGNFRRVLQSDLRQTYFHAIETFFELFFALDPQNRSEFNDEEILYSLTHSNWNRNYERIEAIAKNASELDFLDNIIEFQSYHISVGQYLFYMGVFDKNNFPDSVFANISDSIKAIKLAIKIIATDFIDREEYNAYKHGLRIINSVSKMNIVDIDQQKNIEWDLTDSMSFYARTKNKDEVKIITRLFDSERDYQMTLLCSNLIYNLVYYRRMVYRFQDDEKKLQQVPIQFFGEEEVKKCCKVSVDFTDFVYTFQRKEKV